MGIVFLTKSINRFTGNLHLDCNISYKTANLKNITFITPNITRFHETNLQ